MKKAASAFACVAAFALPAMAQSVTLHPPSAIVAALPQLRESVSLDELPAAIHAGTFRLAGGRTSAGWAIAAPGAPWNATDAIVDPSLPGRRLIVALCGASACVLSYERGGIAFTYFVAGFVRHGSAWTLAWIAEGNERIGTGKALSQMLSRGYEAGYREDPQPGSDY